MLKILKKFGVDTSSVLKIRMTTKAMKENGNFVYHKIYRERYHLLMLNVSHSQYTEHLDFNTCLCRF